MVADRIDVYTRPAVGDGDAHVWRSDGSGNYEIVPAEDVPRGTSIVLHLKEECADFCKQKEVDNIIKKYSNFVNFPVFLNGNKVRGSVFFLG
jgi:TNF receptor-associated protein 1